MYLIELFDKKANWKKMPYGDEDQEFYQTNVNGKAINLIYQRQNGDRYSVDFNTDGETVKTGGRDEHEIFAVVINHIIEWIKQNCPENVGFFSSKGDDDTRNSRSSLYLRIAKRYASSLGYSVDVVRLDDSSDIFVFDRN